MCFVVVFAYAMVACLAILNFYNQGTKYALPNLYLNKDALLESNPSTIPLRIGSSDPNKPLFIFHGEYATLLSRLHTCVNSSSKD